MIVPSSFEEVASYLEREGRYVFYFTADWCGDCRFIQPQMPTIEASNPSFTFIQIDRDAYMELAKLWDIYGIPSFVAVENGKELGRFVSRDRKTKAEIDAFLAGLV
ncbi:MULTISPECIES: thioredoxin family protein [unclassified Streptococcus]|uniref:thioredoxin family protein n=1 Tax=unclassified Streptococcus TaxID=2608887 RepID=UPI0018AABE6D|nr:MULTISPECIES: thioredoxin family protein [unclassified Streptococcus]MBF8969769.1 thioredoxin family protein [Streptococcus sp. NLN76]MBG9367562.1 thioredoxin family protein [Streptococcus sp. NLN64]MBJ6745900.1 thioredoxin family protein [Streptococcus sp. 121]